MDFVKPIQIMSPYSGRMVKPRIVEKRVGQEIYVEAQWYCHTSGEFLRKGIVEVRKVEDKSQQQVPPPPSSDPQT
mgnify:CR=1 FL=1